MLLSTLSVVQLAKHYFAINCEMELYPEDIWKACHPEGENRNFKGGSMIAFQRLISSVRKHLRGRIVQKRGGGGKWMAYVYIPEA